MYRDLMGCYGALMGFNGNQSDLTGFYGDLMGFNGIYSDLMGKWPIEIVSFPIKKNVIFASYIELPERKDH